MPNQTPEPPRVTDGQIEAWERACDDLSAQSSWSASDEDVMIAATRALIAEVKRLRAEEARNVEMARDINRRLATLNTSLAASTVALDSRAPRTTERL